MKKNLKNVAILTLMSISCYNCYTIGNVNGQKSKSKQIYERLEDFNSTWYHHIDVKEIVIGEGLIHGDMIVLGD
jgi:hypothetical protein